MSLGDQGTEPHVIEHPPPMWRVGRSDDLLRFSSITAAGGALPEGVNRFDVPGGAVLYCATVLRGCYAETLARFRLSATIRQVVADEDPNFMVCGGVPATLLLGSAFKARSNVPVSGRHSVSPHAHGLGVS